MKIVICTLLFAAWGCNGAANNQQLQAADTQVVATPTAFNQQPGNTLNGKWRLIPAMPSDTAAGRIPVLNFIMDSKRVAGNTGCNNFSGTFEMDKNSLTFNNDFISTKMACPGYDEAAFERSLLRTTGFEIKGDTLVLKVDQTPLSYWIKTR
jgi:heat shock protein HslJ